MIEEPLTTPTEDPIQRWPIREVPEEPFENRTKIRVTYVDNFGQFYYHLYDDRHQIRYMREIFSDTFKLNARDSESKFDELKQDWKIGEAAICYHTKDRK